MNRHISVNLLLDEIYVQTCQQIYITVLTKICCRMSGSNRCGVRKVKSAWTAVVHIRRRPNLHFTQFSPILPIHCLPRVLWTDVVRKVKSAWAGWHYGKRCGNPEKLQSNHAGFL